MPFLSQDLVNIHRTLSIALLAIGAAACGPDRSAPPIPTTAADSQRAHVAAVAASGGVIDSILPPGEALSRFRADLPEADTLRGGGESIDALVRRFTAALSRRDTAELNAMLLDRAEFAWLYYPDSKISKPPYEAPPDLLWAQLLATSDEGAKRLLNSFGGGTHSVHSVSCPAPSMEGLNRLHEACVVRLTTGAAVGEPSRLFGTILERDGRFKFVGFANAL